MVQAALVPCLLRPIGLGQNPDRDVCGRVREKTAMSGRLRQNHLFYEKEERWGPPLLLNEASFTLPINTENHVPTWQYC
jgi:hypothetical protein